jgi:hypothetical protein
MGGPCITHRLRGYALFDAVASACLSVPRRRQPDRYGDRADAAATAGQFGIRAVVSLVGNASGRHREYVATRPVGTASTVATIYAAVAIMVLSRTGGAVVTESVASAHGNDWPAPSGRRIRGCGVVGYALVILVTIPTTHLITRRLVRTRVIPAAASDPARALAGPSQLRSARSERRSGCGGTAVPPPGAPSRIPVHRASMHTVGGQW